MNRILAETLSALNGVIAVAIVLAGMFIGALASSANLLVVALGGVMGLLVAALTCGIVAYIALIERHLARIASEPPQPLDRALGGAQRDRVEPRL